MKQILRSVLGSYVIAHLSFGVLALLPLVGIHQANWVQLSNFTIVTCGLLFLFFRYSATPTPASGSLLQVPPRANPQCELLVLKIIVFLYFLFLLLVFYPTDHGLYDAIVVVAIALICVSCALLCALPMPGQDRCSYSLRSLSATDKGVMSAILILGLLSVLSRSILGEEAEPGWLGAGCMAAACMLAYLYVSANVAAFAPGPLRLQTVLPYWSLLIATIAVLLGLYSALAVLALRHRARAEFRKGNMVESADLFYRFENSNGLEFALNRREVYPVIAHRLLSGDALPDLDRITFLLDSAAKMVPEGHPQTSVEELLCNGYLSLGNAHAKAGRYEEAYDAYDKATAHEGNPLRILKTLRELDSDQILGIWSGEPYVVLQDFEGVQQVQFRPWVTGVGWTHRVVAHCLSRNAARSGEWAELLDIEYVLDPDPNVVRKGRRLSHGSLYDYWSLPVSIPKPTIPAGVRAYVRGEAGGPETFVCLVAKFPTGNSSGVLRSENITLSEDWSVLNIKGLHDVKDAKLFNHISISVLGPPGLAGSGHAKMYIDDVELFTYFD